MDSPRTMYKYPLDAKPLQRLAVPKGAMLRAVQVQDGVPTIWAEIEPTAETVIKEIRTYATGEPMDDHWRYYLGTYQLDGGQLVFHVYTNTTEIPVS